MTSLLMIISFLLHVVLLSIVYYLYQQIQEIKNERSRDTELLLARFLDEIKQENRLLQQNLQRHSGRKTNQESTSIPEQYPHPQESNYSNTPSSPNIDSLDNTPGFPPIQTEKKDQIETSLASRIFQLYEQGVPMDVIAKQVNRGKTEVELLIRLNQTNT